MKTYYIVNPSAYIRWYMMGWDDAGQPRWHSKRRVAMTFLSKESASQLRPKGARVASLCKSWAVAVDNEEREHLYARQNPVKAHQLDGWHIKRSDATWFDDREAAVEFLYYVRSYVLDPRRVYMVHVK